MTSNLPGHVWRAYYLQSRQAVGKWTVPFGLKYREGNKLHAAGVY